MVDFIQKNPEYSIPKFEQIQNTENLLVGTGLLFSLGICGFFIEKCMLMDLD